MCEKELAKRRKFFDSVLTMPPDASSTSAARTFTISMKEPDQPLLLVHGLGGHMLNITHSLLDKLTCQFRVIVLDRPGSGYSTRPNR